MEKMDHGSHSAMMMEGSGHGGMAHGTMGGGVHTMPGLPSWALLAALAGVLLLSAWAMHRGRAWFRSRGPGRRIELTAFAPLRWLFSKRPFQFALQLPLVLTLLLILVAGFTGSPVAERNLSTVMTWTIWWTLLILDIVLLGRMWCLVCPWDALASWIRRLAFWRRTDEPLSLGLPWPRWLRNVYPATLFFIGLTWLELGQGVTMRPWATALLGLLMILLAVLPALFFERKPFCQYACLVGRICGLYSMIAPVEVRARDAGVCKACRTKACLKGSEHGYPCPTAQCPGTMQTNTYCTVCTECFKTCTEDNVALNLRPWGSDLNAVRRPRRDEAALALVMLSLTSFHGLTMTPLWDRTLSAARSATGLGHLVTFSVGMAVILVIPAAVYLGFVALTHRLIRGRGSPDGGPRRARRRLWQLASAYAYPLVAVALMYHLAHNAGHFLTEAGKLLPVLSDPFGDGSLDLFGTAGFVPRPLLSQGGIWILQVALVLIGHYWAVRAAERAHRTAAEISGLPRVPLRARLSIAAFLVLATALNLWLLAQPMEMRTAM